MNKSLLFILCLIAYSPIGAAVGDHFHIGNLWYTITSESPNEVKVDSEIINGGGWNTKPTGAISIPATVENASTIYDVVSIGRRAFAGCTNVSSIDIPNSVTEVNQAAFYFCFVLTDITLTNSVTDIGDSTFYQCSNLTSIVIPDFVTTINLATFAYCSNLTSVTLPNSLVTIGDSAFYYCANLSSISIPSSVTSIGNHCFIACNALINVTIPGSVNSIGEYAFSSCMGLTSITLPNSITTIEAGLFTYCYGLSSIIIPNSVTSIKSFAFVQCTGLTSITIPNSVVSIGVMAFSDCSNLASLVISSSVTSIEEYAFSNCTSLAYVTALNPTPIAINANVFEGITITSIPLTVSVGAEAAYEAALVWTDFYPISNTTGIDCTKDNSDFHLYPNPSKGFVTVEASSMGSEYSLLNGQGHILSQGKIVNAQHQLDLSNHPTGIYLLIISDKYFRIIKE